MHCPFKKGGLWPGEGCCPFKRVWAHTAKKMHCPFKKGGCGLQRAIALLKEERCGLTISKMHCPFKEERVWHGKECDPFKRGCTPPPPNVHCPFKKGEVWPVEGCCPFKT